MSPIYEMSVQQYLPYYMRLVTLPGSIGVVVTIDGRSRRWREVQRRLHEPRKLYAADGEEGVRRRLQVARVAEHGQRQLAVVREQRQA